MQSSESITMASYPVLQTNGFDQGKTLNPPLTPINSHSLQPEMVATNQPPMPAVVTTQPVPETGFGYIGPPGLEYLAMIDHLLIKQQVELVVKDVMPVFTDNYYVIGGAAGSLHWLGVLQQI